MRKNHRLLSALAGVAASVLAFYAGVPSAHADNNKNKAAAEALFDEGNQLLSSGRINEACAKFEASQALDAGIGTLLYLGDCYERAGRTASAWASFREAESLARASGQGERAQIAATRVGALEGRLPRVAVVIQPNDRVAGMKVQLAGVDVAIASLGAYLPVDPGEQTVVVSAPGHQPFLKHLLVAQSGGRYRVLVPKLEPLPHAEVVHEESDGTGFRTAGIITGSAGVLGLGAGAVFGVMAAKKNDDSLEYCPDEPNHCTPEGVELRKQAGDFADIATASVVAGGGLLATGIVLYVVAPSRRHEQVSATASSAALSMRPLVAQRGVELSLKGKF